MNNPDNAEALAVVAIDVFFHNLPRFTLEALRETVEQGLTPAALDFAGDDDSTIVVIRFTRPRDEDAHLS